MGHMKSICEIAHIDSTNRHLKSIDGKKEYVENEFMKSWFKYEYVNGKRLFWETAWGIIQDNRIK